MSEKPAKGSRRMVVGFDEWYYKVGKQSAVLWNPQGTRSTVSLSKLTGRSDDVILRGRWKRTSCGSVTPKEVRTYIDGLNK
jgi:hypothetical protein